ncbi:hypothetical protein [Rheinheimera sp.]|uniref:hypothetical protein n=1 Tax=Rheinheimera sp. TaxID=1869214 RepID=UPI003AF5131D
MRLFQITALLLTITALPGCTTGQLSYVTPDGEHKTACHTEYSGQPSVDYYAVEYILSYCATEATKQGHTVSEQHLLDINRTLPAAPAGKSWSHELARQLHQAGQLSDKEYGYLIAAMDLGHIEGKTE